MLKFLLKSAIWAVEASYNTPERKGARGERLVHNALTSVLNDQDYRVLTDLILPVAGGTTQIDHLVLSRFGIFVIETKKICPAGFLAVPTKPNGRKCKNAANDTFKIPFDRITLM